MRALLLIILLLLAFTPQSVRAEEEEKQQPTRIEIDQKAGHFTFIIDNEPVARLDKDGVHVVRDVTYGGVLTDAGEEKLKQSLAAPETEAAHE